MTPPPPDRLSLALPAWLKRRLSPSAAVGSDEAAPAATAPAEPGPQGCDPLSAQHAQALLAHLFATNPDIITLTERASGRYVMVNPAFEQTTGYGAEEVIGRTATELGIWIEPNDRAELVRRLDTEGQVQHQPLRFRTRSGTPVILLVSASHFPLDDVDYLVLVCRNVTDAEQARLEREAILENALVGIAMTRDRHFMMVNPRLEQMLGWAPGALVGQHVDLLWPDPVVAATVASIVLPRLARAEAIDMEQPVRRFDGSVFTARLMGKAVDPSHPSQGGTIWMVEDVTARRQAERDLARARDEAEAASRGKSEFLATMSHEIRTPLNALLGLATLARRPELGEDRRHRYVAQMCESAETLSALLTDILDLTKIEAGKMPLEPAPFDLHALLLTELGQPYGSLADARGLHLAVDVDEDLPVWVTGDAAKLRQILTNFLNNALKFTPQGEVRLGAFPVAGKGRLRFEVIDTGPGVDTALQARLFQPFTQADSSATRRSGGTGLGLSICRELAALMGGDVGLVSEPGRGSCFWVELPLPPCDSPEPGEPGTTGTGDMLAGARVLMVEDNPVNMMIAVALMEQWEVIVEQAVHGREALERVAAAMARGNPFDAVIMDIQMPVMSGHEATRELRQRYPRAQVPIIALTAGALASERLAALHAGMDEFLTKPIEPRRLRHALRRVIRRAPGLG